MINISKRRNKYLEFTKCVVRYRRFGCRAASVRTTVRLGVSRSTGLCSLARISRRPIGVETARRGATLPRVYRTLGLTPVTALSPSPLPTASRGNACPYALTPPSRSFSFTPFLCYSHSFIRELYKGSDGHSIFPLANFPNRTFRRT